MNEVKLPKLNNIHFQTKLGFAILDDSLNAFKKIDNNSVDLVMTSPPFGLVRKKEYGNVPASEYIDWFRPFAKEIKRVLKDNGSFVIDIGGAWNAGFATKHLYNFKLLIMLCEEFGFHLAQDFYWWNPSKLPTPAEWVTIRRIRVKDAINNVWWLSPKPWPKASNLRVLQPYSPSMNDLLINGYKAKKRPSGHDISEKFSINNGAAIPPNLIALPNTESNGAYQQYCKKHGLKQHPARYPSELPELFIRMLTDKGDLVIDPFAGSCVTGEVCERLERKWICVDLIKEYLDGAIGRFNFSDQERKIAKQQASKFYQIPRPGILWNGEDYQKLSEDGGIKRKQDKKKLLNQTKILASDTNLTIYKTP